VNALYELAHQILQMRDLSDPATGTKLNWTLAKAGSVVNMITPEAEATADVRVLRVEEYKVLDAKVQERIKNQLLPEAKVTAVLRPGRPPLALTEESRRLATHSQKIYREVGLELKVEDTAVGGGTDAAYAQLEAKGRPVVERYGLKGFGSHSSNAEYVALDNIEPKLYLAARTIMDISTEKVR
jgi:glutamate carboxypeptidase